MFEFVGTNQGLGFTISQPTNVFIVSGASSTTVGVGGSLAIDPEDSIKLVCIEAPYKWAVVNHHSPSGNALVFT
jgi:hypothetical protein